jgi:alpha-glucosidase
MKSVFVAVLVFIFCAMSTQAQRLSLLSPNKKISVALFNQQNTETGEWFLKATYINDSKSTEVIPRMDLGLSRNDQDFSTNLKFLKAGKPFFINEQYTAPHGKKSTCKNQANEVVVSFENPSGAKLNIIIRAYNDGIAFRYEFPEKQGSFIVKDELTSYTIPKADTRWVEKWNPANEGLYTETGNNRILSGEWGYPALFNTGSPDCWFLLHESDVNRNYCGTKLTNIPIH